MKQCGNLVKNKIKFNYASFIFNMYTQFLIKILISEYTTKIVILIQGDQNQTYFDNGVNDKKMQRILVIIM